MNNQPVYPKENPEYRKRVLENFYQKVRNTNWNNEESEYKGKRRGRKPKETKRVESKPRTKLEKKAIETKQIYSNKFFNFK